MEVSLNLGLKVRELRISKGMTIKDLAVASQITPSMLSQIERGQANPSLNTMRLISYALETPLFFFFMEDHTESIEIVKPEDRRSVVDQGLSYDILVPDLNGEMEFCIMTVEPNSYSSDILISHIGEEVGVVTSGRGEVILDGSTHIFELNDSYRLKPNTKHRWRNLGKENFVVIFAVSPPSF